MKIKFEDLKQAVDYMEKHLGTGGTLTYRYDNHLDAIIFSYISLADTDTNIEIYNAVKDVHTTIQERIWLKKR